MSPQWNISSLGNLWLPAALLGLLLILFGVLIFVVPGLLKLIVASVFIFAGCSLVGLAWRLRGRVSYRRMDDDSPQMDDPDGF